MKKTISAKRVLNTLVDEYNEYSKACGYYRATSSTKFENDSRMGQTAVLEIIKNLFEHGKDYYSYEQETETGGIKFYYWRMEIIE